ncbi:MICOS complex subunit MIC27 isoform X2 [Sitophilus oryzae]|uniref:MICOS complex subunit n=1 Tax=Sitophilus oryzae TaxID=7048 RepID=A0A6J2XP58_SITOR|nr:MICOS complex subunit MIC27 isoform X2 [Sitophilus oryzae]
MFNNMVIRKCLLPAAVAVVTEVKSASNTKSDENKDSVCRPSELPIYSSDQQLGNVAVQETKEPNIIEVSFRNIRQVLFKYSEEFKAYEKVAQDSFTESKQNIEWLVDYLRQEDNSLPKAGAIGIGALTGLIFGLRGGIFKRTLYAATGALGMASVCYPKEASEYSQVGAAEGKKILTIAYNFVYGDQASQDVNTPETVSNDPNVSSKNPIQQISLSEPITEPSDDTVLNDIPPSSFPDDME